MKLQRQYTMLNPVKLKLEITKLQNKLYKSVILKQNKDKKLLIVKKLRAVSIGLYFTGGNRLDLAHVICNIYNSQYYYIFK